MTEKSPTHHPERGIARIKSKYIELNASREVNVNFISANDKRSIDPDHCASSPSRKKLKGQNKNRPHNKKTPKSEKLCFSFSSSGICSYGDKCTYSHDMKSYLQTKPEDIKENCYLFETFGNCPYSLSCRFGSKHILDGKNVLNEELFAKFRNKSSVLNVLTKDVQFALRRRTYDFSKSLEALKQIKFTDKQANSVAPSSDINQTEAKTGICGNINLKNEPDSGILDHESGTNTRNDDLLASNPDAEENLIAKGPVKPELPCKLPVDCQTSTEHPVMHSSFPVDKDDVKLRLPEMKKVDFKGKLYLAPLTTVGNLPFRRICKEFGADITCGEMAMATSLLQGSPSEWALLKRHHTEDIFGVQLCGGFADTMTKCCQLLTDNISVDFIDLNLGCPLDMVCRKGFGCGLMNRTKRLEEIIFGVSSVIEVPLTIKMRTGINIGEPIAHALIKRLLKWKECIGLITVHGRSRVQRYTKSADWNYIEQCSKAAHPIPVFGGGDVFSYEDYNLRIKETSVSGIMIARGALIKPWIFKEIKDQYHWDISSGERFDILKSYVNYGLEHWGSDTEGVEKTRRFLLEWLSFLYRYIPVGLLENLPQRINERPPPYHGRNEMETLMASPSCADWIKISEMLLGPVPESFTFLPKHKANAYQ